MYDILNSVIKCIFCGFLYHRRGIQMSPMRGGKEVTMTAFAVAAITLNFALIIFIFLQKNGINISITVKNEPIPGPTLSTVDPLYDKDGNLIDKETKDMLWDISEQIQNVMLDREPRKGGK